MLKFCTLFDANYLSRGLTMYASLKRHCRDMHLFIFAFDDRCLDVLQKLALPAVTVISLREFEDGPLLEVKAKRSPVEYFWTCTPSVIKYVLEKYCVDACTYVDADVFFLDSPDVLLEEMGGNSVLITEHRFTPRYDQTAVSGKYCVQFITFKNDLDGLRALHWWRAACLDWCYAVPEGGKLGDQKYLDDWPERFDGVHELEHLGGGVAPWNVQQYEIFRQGGTVRGREKATGREFSIIFYHFHYLRFFQDGALTMGIYELHRSVRELIYFPYIGQLQKSSEIIGAINGNVDAQGRQKRPPKNWKRPIKVLKDYLRDRPNMLSPRELNEIKVQY